MGLHFPEPNVGPEVLLAVMGPTGSGKTSFVNLASGTSRDFSEDLPDRTADIQITGTFHLDGHRVRLIDTPGFDESQPGSNDADVLQEIAIFLEAIYRAGHKINGLLYFHRITDRRVSETLSQNLAMFRNLCGDEVLKNTFICTTMWDLMPLTTGEDREVELAHDLWAPMISKGASMVRHNGTEYTARTIIARMLDLPPITLQIQQELAVDNRTLMHTSAGAKVNKDIQRKEADLESLLIEAREDLQRAIEDNDMEMIKRIELEMRQYERSLKQIQAESQILARDQDQEIGELARRIRDLETGKCKDPWGTLRWAWQAVSAVSRPVK
ncbi:hypothetical protein BOTBODRAFT_127631 [Botryobasidium botryosum FD-172 SS1]|uniref:G domain-containing protein n=1 Tax=Botryobasidium botryosum (strain FD-172 SS1) TaxID=930990 RepID=A0A067MVI7_BOTB1|nr:hypothetical protein BOTBODRAFT_127631 [Botryobasidium botryosum FD-172 SS1]